MRTTSLASFSNALRALRRARDGNVASMFALALVPMVGLVGAGIDYGRANAARTELQSALDSTALMLSKEVVNLTQSQLQTKATDYFKALFTTPDVTDLIVTPTFTTNDGFELTVTGSGTVPNEFMGLFGHKTTKINSFAQVKWGNKRLRVALVLDNTGSMSSSGKMTALKTATKNLLKQLKDAATNSADVYVSIVPFSKGVNVGSEKFNATWLDFTDWDTKNGTCSKNAYKNKKNCVAANEVWTSKNRNTWNGCIMDRGPAVAPNPQDWDQKIDEPNPGIPASLYPAEQYGSCPQEILPLTNDWTALNNLVDGMFPAGSTNQPIGLVWGWLSLAGKTPLTAPAKDGGFTYQDVIILLTDGLNTQNRWFGNGSVVSPPVDQRMLDPGIALGTCDNIKKANVTIYAVQVNTGGDPTSTLLQKCATDASKFFLLTNANQMITTFEKIGSTLSQLRLAK